MPTEPLTLHARYGVIVETAKNTAAQAEGSIYLSTYQPGRGQHIIALDPSQARTLARHLIAISAGVDTEVGTSLPGPEEATASIHPEVQR